MHAVMAKRLLPHQPSEDTPHPDDELESPAIEAAALAIAVPQPTDQTLQKAFWERYNSPEKSFKPAPEGTTVLRFEILMAHIMPREGDDPKLKRYVVYELTVRQDSQVMDAQPAKLERRYTDFRELYQCLKREHPNELGQLNFPNKVLMGNFSADLIRERSMAFEAFLSHVAAHPLLKESPAFLRFLQHEELTRGCQYLDERRNEMAIPILENCFRLLNKIYMNRSRPVVLILCRLVAACTVSPVPHLAAERWALLALSRFDTLCDIDLLPLYIPLLHTCTHLWWQRGQDQKPITDRLTEMSRQGINTANITSLTQAIHKLDPRTETI
ncbi:sorting nexin-21 isoform X2 [Drosophila nasuta]|uniref:sorting nexin-21 isoform X1 n=1 Tax=Drosophila nasuta TaxID=42062 RepID=UPI00295F28C6|nr:sorting nexin-21 isoform X1 [Drosophila nasuta]XP_060664744.1 sorting nexin-21 isoform X2 [Drosophila nasuta]